MMSMHNCNCWLSGATFHACKEDSSEIAVLQRRREEAWLRLACIAKQWGPLEEAGFQLEAQCKPFSVQAVMLKIQF